MPEPDASRRPISGAIAYLAGPDVFYPDALERAQTKKAALAAAGITGLFPLDNEIHPALLSADPKAAAFAIARANESMMLECTKPGIIGFILANMEPWHGPSMDVGTAFEMGFMRALASLPQADVTIIGYAPDNRLFADRVQAIHFRKLGCATLKDGHLVGPDGMTLENFGLTDNLMLVHAVEKTGGAICASFEDAVQYAAARVKARLAR
jgi:nucleoside 2-deoxyribosyltransferase